MGYLEDGRLGVKIVENGRIGKKVGDGRKEMSRAKKMGEIVNYAREQGSREIGRNKNLIYTVRRGFANMIISDMLHNSGQNMT